MITIDDKTKCCGCTACYSICPNDAIQMIFDEEGFRYPKVDFEKCIHCGLCSNVCPEKEAFVDNNKKNGSCKYAIQNVSDEERSISTAGGFFYVIAEYIIEACNGSVFAVGFDGNTVTHMVANSVENLQQMCGSKYVQSDLNDIFLDVKKTLHQGKKCLYVGTPCQVHGIRKFLSNDKMAKNLITIDLLCLGVSSPMLYQKWINYLEKKYKDKVTYVYFRDKSYGYATANVRVCFERKYIEQTYDAKSLMKTFFSGYNMRPSCYDCDFRLVERASDFTLGDMHQIGDFFSYMDDDKGTTCVWAHTERAKELLELLNNRMRKEMLEDNCLGILYTQSKLVKRPIDRKDFFLDANRLTYDKLTEKYVKNGIEDKVINYIRRIVNKLPFRTVVFKTMKSIKMKSFQKHVDAVNANSGGSEDE